MPTEKQNNTGWRNKLNENGDTGTPVFNKYAVWDKLHDRMHPKRRRVKAVWYWYGAACVLILIISGTHFFRKNELRYVPTDIVKKKKEIPKFNAADTVRMVSLAIQKKKPFTPYRSKKAGEVIDRTFSRLVTPLEANSSKQNSDTLVNPLVSVYHDPVMVAAKVPAKNKMKVVHINEMDSPPDDLVISSSPNEGVKVFNSLFNHSLSQPGSHLSNNDYTGLIRIKISTQK